MRTMSGGLFAGNIHAGGGRGWLRAGLPGGAASGTISGESFRTRGTAAQPQSAGSGKVRRAMPEDFERIISENSRKLYGSVYGMVGNAEEAEEIVQEIFYQVYRSYGSFKGDAAVSTWLYRIMMNVVSDHIKKSKRQPARADRGFEEYEGDAAVKSMSGNVEKSFFRNQTMREINAAVLRLPLQYRAAFVLCVAEERSAGDAAKIMGVSAGVVRIRLYRAIRMLREILGGAPEVVADENV